MMATAFLGYICVWGQMSLWGATVITNLFGAIPIIGDSLVVYLWGGYSVDNPTLKRFFILHFLLPLVMVIISAIHLGYLHRKGSANPLGVDTTDVVTFYPRYVIKDLVGLVLFYGVAVIFLIFYYPNLLGHPDNYIMANALVTPKHITPE
jgi:ubiquinol-cytochrome c reductase cytochrome b subunit